MRRFWWGVKSDSNRYLALRSWKEICKPKICGGLSFRLFNEINTALLAKLGWKLATGERSLWADQFRGKYLRSESFFNYSPGKNISMVWRGILSAKKALLKGACFKIGNGLAINPWTEPWIPWIEGFIPNTKEGIDCKVWSRVADLRLPDGSDWNVDLLATICDPDIVEAIKKMDWPQTHCYDKDSK